MKVVNSITELIGDTPVVKLNKLKVINGAQIYAKLESFNPMNSVKDRICLNMLETAERQGLISPGTTLIEPTSGNTGIGLAYICAVKGYPLVLTMPETMSMERRRILKAFGAELVLTPGDKGMKGAIAKAAEMGESRGWIQLKQFENPANPEIHRQTTAKEIISQVPDLDAFVAGVGTGGTITGVGEMLRETEGAKVKIVAVEPEASKVLSGGDPGPHKIQGIGAGFVPAVLNTQIIDRIITVSNEQAAQWARKLAEVEGIFAGISSGAAMAAAAILAEEMNEDQKVVVMLPDFGERYLSTELFARNGS